MNWKLIYLPEAERDYNDLPYSQRIVVDKVVKRVRRNPLPQNEGGYGKPLGHKRGRNLTGLLKIKLKADGLRVIYKLIRTESTMLVVVIGIREDEEVYEIAEQRIKQHEEFDI